MNSLDTKRTLIKETLGSLVLNRVQDVLNLVYIDIYVPFPTASWNGHEYFITFTDTYYMRNPNHWTYLKFIKLTLKIKIYKVEVEN